MVLKKKMKTGTIHLNNKNYQLIKKENLLHSADLKMNVSTTQRKRFYCSFEIFNFFNEPVKLITKRR